MASPKHSLAPKPTPTRTRTTTAIKCVTSAIRADAGALYYTTADAHAIPDGLVGRKGKKSYYCSRCFKTIRPFRPGFMKEGDHTDSASRPLKGI
jgi:hypothetical protein